MRVTEPGTRPVSAEGAELSKDTSRRATEWRTVGLLAAFISAWLAIVLGHQSIPWPVQLVVLVYLGGLWMSLGHELLHGHPTRWNWLNSMIGFVPLSFWLPFLRYKALHIKHHLSDLTDPEDDPESFYVPPASWQRAGPLRRRYLLFLRTAAGRLTVGVPRGILRFWRREVRLAPQGGIVGRWMAHVAGSVVFGWWLFGVVGVNPWVYGIGFCLGGSSCTQLRSFVEHAAVAEGTRCAVVNASPPMALLFLNNNLHYTHHALPDLEWYRLPAMHRQLGSDQIAAAGAGRYAGGYLEVMRRYFLRPFCQPDHPLSPGARPHGARGIAR